MNTISFLTEIATDETPDSFNTGWAASRRRAALNLLEVLEKGKPLAFGGYKRTILLFGLKCLPEVTLGEFAKAWTQGKSHSNRALIMLQGVPARIRLAKNGSSWVVDLGIGDPIEVLEGQWNSIPCQNVSNGAGHWLALCNKSLALERIAETARGEKRIHPQKLEILQRIADTTSHGGNKTG